MQLKFSAPCKTFILGEYAVLSGSPAIILNCEPRFQLAIRTDNKNSVKGIHPDSPAGIFISRQSEFENYCIEFTSPYTQGGVGSSTAEFLLCYAALAKIKNSIDMIEPMNLLACYLSYAFNGKGVAPSGADILAQLIGNFSIIDKSNQQFESYDWPFENCMCVIVATGNKLATHEYLTSLNHLKTDILAELTQQAIDAVQTQNQKQFIKIIHDYNETLSKLGLVAQRTKELLIKLYQYDFVFAAKGCGAMGADTLAVFIDPSQERILYDWLEQNDLISITSSKRISPGLQIHDGK